MNLKDNDIKKEVRERYARAANTKTSCCAPAASPCCGGQPVLARIRLVRWSAIRPKSLPAFPKMPTSA